jgi:prophage antirepressor-like protein
MDIVKAFNSNDLHTEIIIKGDINNPLFRASDIGTVLEISNIRTSINDFNESEKVVHTMDTLGGSQQVTFLTEKGLYKVLFKSRKPIAEKFQNWVCEVIKEIRLNGVYDLQKELEKSQEETKQVENIKKKEYDIKLGEQKMIEREKILLKEYEPICSLVYFVKVKTFENGTYIIKIGESRKGITGRYNEHKSKYEECLLLDCFAVNNSLAFESFLQKHDSVRLNRVTDLPGHETDTELFLIGKKLSYQTLLQIANHNHTHFNDNDIRKQELENANLKLLIELKQNDNSNVLILELIQQVKHLSSKMDNLEKSNKEMLEKFNSTQTKTTTNFNQPLVTLGPKLQQINPETMLLNKVYESVAECIKESNFILKRPSIVKAINENTIYHGYRWAFVDRLIEDSTIIVNIAETMQTKVQCLGYIAKLNKDKTEILNVYLDRKTAASCNGYQSSSALDTPVKKFSLTNGHYYVLYNVCLEEKLMSNFVNKYGSPLLYKDGIGQFNGENQLVKEFVCKYDCIKQLKMSDKTLAKALDKNILYNAFYFKSIGAKLSAI